MTEIIAPDCHKNKKDGSIIHVIEEVPIKTLALDQLKELMQQTASPSISIFLPTHRSGQEIQQNPIRFKNLLREVEKQFLESGMGPREVNVLLQPAQALLEDSYFWEHQYEGLVVFLAADDFHYYRLPFGVEELLVIDRSYYIKPVLPLFTNDGHYFILAISQNAVCLFEGTRRGVRQIELPNGTPESLEEALELDDPQKQLQLHAGSATGVGRDATFYGQGPGEEEQKVWIERYLNLVGIGLKEIFREQQPPLILAGVDYLLPIYRKVSDYVNILQESIIGRPEHLCPEELQKQAWPIAEAYFCKETEKAMEQYQQLAGTDKATDNIDAIIAAAFNARVDKLILAVETQKWGAFNPDIGNVIRNLEGQRKVDDIVLLDFVALKTLQNNGTVYGLSQKEMPKDSPVATFFHY